MVRFVSERKHDGTTIIAVTLKMKKKLFAKNYFAQNSFFDFGDI